MFKSWKKFDLFFFSGQTINGKDSSKLNGNSNGADGLDTTASEADLDDDNNLEMNDDQLKNSSTLKIDKNLVPVDLRLHGYLSNLAKVC